MKADDAMRVTPSSKLQWWWSGQRGKKIATRATAAVRIAHRPVDRRLWRAGAGAPPRDDGVEQRWALRRIRK